VPAPDRISSPEVLRSDFVAIVANAKASLDAVEAKFIAPYLNLTRIRPANQYDYDVAAYCILSHGILEYLIEDIALAAIFAVESDWATLTRLSDPLAATLLFLADPKEAQARIMKPTTALSDGTTGEGTQGVIAEMQERETKDRRPIEIMPRDEIRRALKAAKREISNRVNSNNGIEPKNVALLAFHLGVVICYQLLESGASETLARFRGARAHGSSIYEPTSPNDARTLVTIMFGFFRRIAARTAEKLSRPVAGMPT
jgi:hypothetical protein